MPVKWMTAFGAAIVAVGLGTVETAEAGQQQIVLRDYIQKQWDNELLSYPFHAEKGQCHPDSVTVTGPAGPVACQLSNVELWPGPTPSVKSARLWFVADLAPLASDTYTVGFGPEPAAGPKTDLVVQPAKDHVQITTERFGAKLLLGKASYRRPRDPAKVPGPIGPMRLPAGDGAGGDAWFGGSRMGGKTPITGYEAELTASGPVFAEVRVRYAYADGNTLEVRAHLAAGESALMIDTNVAKDNKHDGWDLLIDKGLPPLTLRVQGESRSKFGLKLNQWADIPLADQPAGTITSLTPWHDWFTDATLTVIRLQMPGRDRELQFRRRDPGVWVDPGPIAKFGGNNLRSEKSLPLTRSASGEVYLRINNLHGQRRWSVGLYPVPEKDPENFAYMGRFKVVRPGRIGRHLDQVKDWVLQWDVKADHPHLFMNREQLRKAWKRPVDKQVVEELLKASGPRPDVRSVHPMGAGLSAWLMTGDPEVARRAFIVERLRNLLARTVAGEFPTMNGAAFLCAMFDAVMGSGLFSEEDRNLFWAQLAYVGYRMASPATWSMERGYSSGNLNMSITSNLHLGLVACTIPDHPMAREWVAPGLVMMEDQLAKNVGPAGEWPESIANYMHVSQTPMLCFAIATRNAGLADFISDPRMKRMLLYNAKQYTPPDPRHTERGKDGKMGLMPPIGRGPGGKNNGLVGAMAAATAQSDPDYSRILQWVWLRSGRPYEFSANRFGGWGRVLLDPTLPAEKPDWQMNVFPRTGAILRHGLGTPQEWYVYLVCDKQMTIPTESGTIPMLFAKGVPISARMVGSYPDREELLLSRVLLARRRGDLAYRHEHYGHEADQRKITRTTALPRQQYVVGEFTIDKPFQKKLKDPTKIGYDRWRRLPEWPEVPAEGKPGVAWQRQLLFVRDQKPGEVNYLVLRDSVRGGQPTIWQFWVTSEKIGTPEQVADREAFLADAPGHETLPPRRLPQSDRYTAVGQFDVDVEFYVAEPADTPRHTLRFGLVHDYISEFGGYTEYQDLLHLQRPDDGSYMVAIFPRRQTEEVPRFETLAGGKVIAVSGRFGKDLCYLSEVAAEVTAGEAAFEGTAGTVQDRQDGLVLTLGAKGHVRYKQHALGGEQAASLRVAPDGLVVELPRRHPGATVTMEAPGSWALKDPAAGVNVVAGPEGRLRLTVPAGTERVRLVSK